jgi:hypothetical protein
MTKKVSEITSGQSNERTVDGGKQADVSVRTWRVILDSPSEPYDIQQAIDVYIGDPHPVNTGLPCVSIGERAEGDSRVVRIVTATYRTTPGSDPESGDPNLIEPTLRPANYSISCALMEVPVTQHLPGEDGGTLLDGPPRNPIGDMYEGLFKSIPIVTIRIEQFEAVEAAPTGNIDFVGTINDAPITFVGYPIAKHGCMFRSLEIRPHVETWGTQTRRGFMVAYEFVVRTDESKWNVRIPQAGFNIKNARLGDADVDTGALSLELTDGGRIKDWPDPDYAVATQDRKMRANILIAHPEGGASQRPSAQPVALNDDGTPRKVEDGREVIIKTFQVQPEATFGDNFFIFGCRLNG